LFNVSIQLGKHRFSQPDVHASKIGVA